VSERHLGREHQVEQTDACLICGEPWTRERLADYTVIVVGSGIEHCWLCHRNCLRAAAHPRFAARFAKPNY
jgi:hypothetical protein